MNLVDELIKTGQLKTANIIEAFRKIKRQDFVLSPSRNEVEIDRPQEIGFGQTISQPSTVAFMLELCRPKKGDRVLDIGSGSGWAMALFAEIVGPEGRIYGIERIEELKEFGEHNLEKYNFIKQGRAILFCGDGSKGLSEFAPYDIIHVGAAAGDIPAELLKQLKIGGRLVIPVGTTHEQDILLIERIEEQKYNQQKFSGFIFVPLIEG